jgi:hypothetical protein
MYAEQVIVGPIVETLYDTDSLSMACHVRGCIGCAVIAYGVGGCRESGSNFEPSKSAGQPSRKRDRAC